jgi:hypothetical protein
MGIERVLAVMVPYLLLFGFPGEGQAHAELPFQAAASVPL